MRTECNVERLDFQALGRRKVVADFSGGRLTSDGGALLLREVACATGLIGRLAGCFRDCRDADLIEHPVEELLAQRIYGLALGYEDLNDHDTLRRDPLLATLVGKADPTGQGRLRARDRGAPLAGKSTLNRLELTAEGADAASRYQKIVYDGAAIERVFVDLFLEAHAQAPVEIVLDVDATDDPVHGNQEGRFFHGYYGSYCYLPLYIFCDDFLLWAQLRPSNQDASAGTVEALEKIVSQVRARWPEVKIVLRADSGFAREAIMAWCEKTPGVDYVLGLAKNPRLLKRLRAEADEAREAFEQTGQAARRFGDFLYQTRSSWSRARRVVGKAEHLEKGPNPRFLVTSLSPQRFAAVDLYEKLYCARGEMENRIKEQQADMFADRTSAETLRANQLRLWLSSAAYVLVNELRRVGLRDTELAQAQTGTIRNKILKIGAQIVISVRRIFIRLASACPYHALLQTILRNIRAAYPLRL